MFKRVGFFTLTELLGVVGIVVILAVTLFPVFEKAREKGKQINCMGNVKQLCNAWTMYAGDYNDCCPALVLWPQINPAYPTWEGLIYPYIKSWAAFGCPSGIVTPGPYMASGNTNMYGTDDYGMNASVFNYPWYFLVKMSDLDTPSDTVVICDSGGSNWLALPGGNYWNYANPALANRTDTARPTARHNGSVNCAFADGHVKAMAYDELIKTVPNTSGRKVTKNFNSWTSATNITIFPHFAVSASHSHM